MLAHNLVDRVRRELAKGRDCRLDCSVEEVVAESSHRLRDWLPADQSTPSEKLMRQERALQLAEALAKLPEREREAIVLQQWHGWKLAQIAEHLNCTIGVVAGLQARGRARMISTKPQRRGTEGGRPTRFRRALGTTTFCLTTASVGFLPYSRFPAGAPRLTD
jgi:DNA-directed RNA polymerase specialized sigma24 family protein